MIQTQRSVEPKNSLLAKKLRAVSNLLNLIFLNAHSLVFILGAIVISVEDDENYHPVELPCIKIETNGDEILERKYFHSLTIHFDTKT